MPPSGKKARVLLPARAAHDYCPGARSADAWIWTVSSKDAKKGGGANRAARLEAQLRVNLKKRKEQARARARGVDAKPRDAKDASPDGGEE